MNKVKLSVWRGLDTQYNKCVYLEWSSVRELSSFFCVHTYRFMNTRNLYINSTLTLRFCSSITVHIKSKKKNENISHHFGSTHCSISMKPDIQVQNRHFSEHAVELLMGYQNVKATRKEPQLQHFTVSLFSFSLSTLAWSVLTNKKVKMGYMSMAF